MTVHDLERIEIFTKSRDFRDPLEIAKLAIVRNGNRFPRELFPRGKADELPVEVVKQFLTALSRPLVPQFDYSLFPVSESVVRTHYGYIWSNDSAAHLIKATFSNGRIVVVRTEGKHQFMLPLSVSDSDTNTVLQTFDPRLSQAIADLMPDGYLEKERLGGHDFLELSRKQIHHPDQSAEEPVVLEPAEELSELPANVDESSSGIDGLIEIVFGEETPAEKAEAERTGKLSERLLKRIPLQDVRELLARGANPSIADENGITALMYAEGPPLDEEKFRLLVQAGANLEARRFDGATGLLAACEEGETRAVEEWIRAGANIHARTPGESTPLMHAARWHDIVQMLLAAGADVNAVDKDGHSALAYAILNMAELETIQALIAAGTDMNHRDCSGITALGNAREGLDRMRSRLDVFQEFNPDELSRAAYQEALQWGEAVVNLIASAGGRA